MNDAKTTINKEIDVIESIWNSLYQDANVNHWESTEDLDRLDEQMEQSLAIVRKLVAQSI